jgi:hypothetical protein
MKITLDEDMIALAVKQFVETKLFYLHVTDVTLHKSYSTIEAVVEVKNYEKLSPEPLTETGAKANIKYTDSDLAYAPVPYASPSDLED